MANAAISQDISVLTNHVSMVSKTSESLPEKGATSGIHHYKNGSKSGNLHNPSHKANNRLRKIPSQQATEMGHTTKPQGNDQQVIKLTLTQSLN